MSKKNLFFLIPLCLSAGYAVFIFNQLQDISEEQIQVIELGSRFSDDDWQWHKKRVKIAVQTPFMINFTQGFGPQWIFYPGEHTYIWDFEYGYWRHSKLIDQVSKLRVEPLSRGFWENLFFEKPRVSFRSGKLSIDEFQERYEKARISLALKTMVWGVVFGAVTPVFLFFLGVLLLWFVGKNIFAEFQNQLNGLEEVEKKDYDLAEETRIAEYWYRQLWQTWLPAAPECNQILRLLKQRQNELTTTSLLDLPPVARQFVEMVLDAWRIKDRQYPLNANFYKPEAYKENLIEFFSPKLLYMRKYSRYLHNNNDDPFDFNLEVWRQLAPQIWQILSDRFTTSKGD